MRRGFVERDNVYHRGCYGGLFGEFLIYCIGSRNQLHGKRLGWD
jgi:hypothetical protein